MQKKMQTNAKNFSGDGVSDVIVQIEQLLRKNFINKSQLAAYLGSNGNVRRRMLCEPPGYGSYVPNLRNIARVALVGSG